MALVVATLTAVSADVAGATDYSGYTVGGTGVATPANPSGGVHAFCNVTHQFPDGSGSPSIGSTATGTHAYAIACNVPPVFTPGPGETQTRKLLIQHFIVDYWASGTSGTVSSATTAGPAVQSDGGAWTGDNLCPAKGAVCATGTVNSGSSGGLTNKQIKAFRINFRYCDLATPAANCSASLAAEVQSVVATSSLPARPEDKFTGGEPGGIILPKVEPPQLNCERRMRQVDGEWFVTSWASVLNPQAGATDELTIRYPWESTGRTGPAASHEVKVPADGQPPDGWRGMCLLKRTLNPSTHIGATLATGPGDGNVTGFLERPETSAGPDGLINADGTAVETLGGFTTPGAIGATTLTVAAGGGTAGAAAASAAGLSVAAATGLVAGAGLLVGGLLYAGHKSGAVSLTPDGCTLYDRVRQLLDPFDCAPPVELEVPPNVYLRQQVTFLSPEGVPMTKTELASAGWLTAQAVAEVLIDPLRPLAGAQTVTALQPSAAVTALDTDTWTQIKTDPAALPVPDPVPQVNPIPYPWPSPQLNPAGLDCSMSVLETLNPFNLGRSMKCVLVWAFVPSTETLTETWEETRNRFPLVAVDEGYAGLVALADGLSTAVSADPCMSIDYRPATPDSLDGGGVGALDVHLPTPASAGCAQSTGLVDPDNDVGDLWGYRLLVRTVILIGITAMVALKCIRAFTPGGAGASEAEPVG